MIDVLGPIAAGQHRLDLPLLDVGGVERGVEQQRQIRLADALVVEQQVPQLPTALRVARRVVEPEFFQQTTFAPARPTGVAIGADDVHLDLARRIATQPRAVLHQHHPSSRAGRRHRRANTGQSAAGHQHVGGQLDQLHVLLGRRLGRLPRRRDAGQLGANLVGRTLAGPMGIAASWPARSIEMYQQRISGATGGQR